MESDVPGTKVLVLQHCSGILEHVIIVRDDGIVRCLHDRMKRHIVGHCSRDVLDFKSCNPNELQHQNTFDASLVPRTRHNRIRLTC
jgi:hypothetical protein